MSYTNPQEKFAFFSVTFLLFYLSYRYPLQINFSGTSPTYTDTPLFLQLTKFFIAILSCLYLSFFNIKKLSGSGLTLSYLILLFECPQLFKGLILIDKNYIENSFWIFTSFLFALHLRSISENMINKSIKILFLFSISVNLTQLILFLTYNRLPALAYDGSLSVRFGSFLDDPNGFSALCFLFVGWSLGLEKKSSRYAYTLLATLMILISQSLTSIGILLMLFLIKTLKIIFIEKSPAKIFALCIFILLAITFIACAYDYLLIFYEIKEASIKEHTQTGFLSFFDGDIIQILVGGVDYKFYESWWMRSFFNMGIIWCSIQITLNLFYLVILYYKLRKSTNTVEKKILLATSIFSLAFFIGSFNLPFGSVFPINFLYYLLMFLTLLGFNNKEFRARHENAI